MSTTTEIVTTQHPTTTTIVMTTGINDLDDIATVAQATFIPFMDDGARRKRSTDGYFYSYPGKCKCFRFLFIIKFLETENYYCQCHFLVQFLVLEKFLDYQNSFKKYSVP